MTLSIPPQPLAAMDLLERAGHEVYLVGGAVRDCILGVPAQDWDLTTSALPQQVMAVFHAYPLIDTGLKHGTVTVLLDGLPLEITTYRVDGAYSDNRRPDQVTFTHSLREDLARRDFTINALAYHPAHGLVDYFRGLDDLRRGIIRCVGEPDLRFHEDGLRLLRALRFSSALDMEIEPHTAAAVRRCRALLSGVAAERLRAELDRLLTGPGADRVLLEYPDVLSVPIPELLPCLGFDQHSRYHCHTVWGHTAAVVQAAPPIPVLRWAALLHDLGKPACFSLDDQGEGHFYGHAALSAQLSASILERLHFDHTSRDQILFLVRHHGDQLSPDPQAVKRAIQRHGAARLRLLLQLFQADTMGLSPQCLSRLAQYDQLRVLIDRLAQGQDRFTRKDLAVTGRDLLALGYEGPELGAALQSLVDAVVFQGLPNQREALLAHLRH